MQTSTNSLTSKKSIILFSAMVTILSIGVIQYTETLAQETSDEKYVSANNITITAIFDFHEGQEISAFEVFRQTSGFNPENETPRFILERIVGDTPLLYKGVDQTFKYKEVSLQHDWKFFDVQVIISQQGKHVRAFDYNRCQFTDYKVWTYRDPNESWTTSQGFATADVIEFICEGYHPNNPLYDSMKIKGPKGSTQSSLDLGNNVPTWEEHPKFQN